MGVLDNWVWDALTGPQSDLAEGGGAARRYHPEVSSLVALPHAITPEAWDDLAALVGPDGRGVLIRAETVSLPRGWHELLRLPAVQMLAPSPQNRPSRAGPAAGGTTIERLGPDDVPAMLDLVANTEPGPFEARTIELGTYVGVRDGARLVAMAGQRVRPQGFTEISAVCTLAEHRGRGLAGALVNWLVDEIHQRGDAAFLHAASSNATAISRYRSLGFTVRREVQAVAFSVAH